MNIEDKQYLKMFEHKGEFYVLRWVDNYLVAQYQLQEILNLDNKDDVNFDNKIMYYADPLEFNFSQCELRELLNSL